MALTLHYHPLSSYCHKVLIALYENGTPFEKHLVDFGDENSRSEFLALWPTGKIPLLCDSARDKTIPETSIMVEYLDRHYPGAHSLFPADDALCLEARLWDRLFDLYVMTPMQAAVSQRLRPEAERDPKSVSDAVATLKMAYGMIERQLAGKTWAIGKDFGIADCAAAPSLFFAEAVTEIPASHAKLRAYFERLIGRPSISRVIDEARPFFQYFPLKDALPARFALGA